MAGSPHLALQMLGSQSLEAYMFNPDMARKHQESTPEDSSSSLIVGGLEWVKTLTLGLTLEPDVHMLSYIRCFGFQ